MSEAFFFGPRGEQVFATYHAPFGGSGHVLTIICPPLFTDYMRTQLALRELAVALAGRGQHVLRLDYRGTGDSHRELHEVAVSEWLDDIAHAVQEGRDLSGSSVVRLLGVRAGALLACKSVGASAEVQQLVLWDPVADGAGYLEMLSNVQRMMLDQFLHLSRAERREAMQEYAGYSLNRRMLDEFRSLDASAYSNVPETKLHVVSTSPHIGFPVPAVSQHMAPFKCHWNTIAHEPLMPRPVLERLVACLTLS